MANAKYDLALIVGCDFGPVLFRLRDADEEPIPLNGSSVAAQIRTTPEAKLLANLAPVISDAEDGEISLSIAADVVAGIPPGGHGWDLILTDANGRKSLLLSGSVKVTRAYTHA